MEEPDLVSELSVRLGALSPDDEDLVGSIDSWCAEVLANYNAVLSPGDLPVRGRPTLDDLVGSYLARDRLSRFDGAEDLLVVKAADELLKSFTADEGSRWVDDHGHLGTAGAGWWWSRLPTSGPIREELERIEGHR